MRGAFCSWCHSIYLAECDGLCGEPFEAAVGVSLCNRPGNPGLKGSPGDAELCPLSLQPSPQVLESKQVSMTDGNCHHQVTWWELRGAVGREGFGARQLWFKSQLYSSHLWGSEQTFEPSRLV